MKSRHTKVHSINYINSLNLSLKETWIDRNSVNNIATQNQITKQNIFIPVKKIVEKELLQQIKIWRKLDYLQNKNQKKQVLERKDLQAGKLPVEELEIVIHYNLSKLKIKHSNFIIILIWAVQERWAWNTKLNISI